MKAISGTVPYWPNRNQVMPRTPSQPHVATTSVPACWSASDGMKAATISRYRNITSKKATKISTAIICPTYFI